MIFEYLQRIVVDGQIDIENIGQCFLRAFNDFGEEFYLLIKTDLGITEVLEYGPCTPDLELLPPSYHVSYDRFDYSQTKIERIIEKFLNNPKRAITQVEEFSDLSELRDNLVNPVDKVFS